MQTEQMTLLVATQKEEIFKLTKINLLFTQASGVSYNKTVTANKERLLPQFSVTSMARNSDHGQYSNKIKSTITWIRFPAAQKFSLCHNVHTGSGAHLASYQVDTGFFPRR
jgi:hypothetical protein